MVDSGQIGPDSLPGPTCVVLLRDMGWTCGRGSEEREDHGGDERCSISERDVPILRLTLDIMDSWSWQPESDT